MQELFSGLKNDCAIALWLGGLLAVTFLQSSRAQSVTLAWNASTNADVAGYKIYYGGSSGNYTNVLSVGNVTTATISNLIVGTTYYFAATAYNFSGVESRFSNEAVYVPNHQLPTLGTLRNVTVYENSSTRMVMINGISSGNPHQTQTLTVSATASDPNLVSNLGVRYVNPNKTATLSFTPGHNLSGSAFITVTVDNHNLSNNIISKTFLVTVVPTQSFFGTGTQTANTSTVVKRATLAARATAFKVNPKSTLQPAASLDSPICANGSFTFSVNGVSGYKYAIQASTDMVNWISLETNIAPFLFVDTNSSQFTRRFYRSVYLP